MMPPVTQAPDRIIVAADRMGWQIATTLFQSSEDPRSQILGLALAMGRMMGRAGWSEAGKEDLMKIFDAGYREGLLKRQ